MAATRWRSPWATPCSTACWHPASSITSTRWASASAGTCSSLAQRFPNQVLEQRGKGLLAGIRIASPVRDVAARLRDEHHMLAMTANENVLRLLPPLVVTEADIEEAMGKLAAVFEAIEAEAPGKATA